MVRRILLAAACAALAVGTAVAAEAVKADLSKAKFEPANSELVGYSESDSRLFFHTNGTATVELTVPADGEYTLVVEASCDEAQNEKAKIKLAVGDKVVKDDFALTATDAKEYKFEAKLTKGTAKLSVSFVNDKYKENEYDLNLFVHSIRIEAKK